MLEALVGEWTQELSLEGGRLEHLGLDVSQGGRMTIEWELDGRFLMMRSEIAHPDFPDNMAIIAPNAEGDGYTFHYFDTRGVVRVLAMTLEDRTWTLLRDKPDFTPLNFSQRFIGTISDDGATITGAWEAAEDGVHWAKDFDVTYRKVR